VRILFKHYGSYFICKSHYGCQSSRRNS
jgi:hypothetical protein